MVIRAWAPCGKNTELADTASTAALFDDLSDHLKGLLHILHRAVSETATAPPTVTRY